MIDQALSLIAPAQTAIGNPYEDAGRHRRAVEQLTSRRRELPGAIGVLLEAGRLKEAGRLLFAHGWLALRHGHAPLRDPTLVPDAWLARLGFGRAAVAAVVEAAQRCQERLDAMVGVSTALERLKAQVFRACFGPSLEGALHLAQVIRDQNVLVLGETGTGKELVAAAIQAGTVWTGDGPPPGQSLSAAAIPAELLESELFGHRKGAFSDAVRNRTGKIVAASGGTLFLDEIADLPLDLQPKLLRAIESNRVCPVGDNEEIVVDVRYVSATCRPLPEMAERGEFRADLFERLAGAVVRIPPLRERREDIRPIAERLLARLEQPGGNARAQASAPGRGLEATWMREARQRLERDIDEAAERHDWPGNVRELQTFVRTRLLGLDDPRHPRSFTPRRAAAPAFEPRPAAAVRRGVAPAPVSVVAPSACPHHAELVRFVGCEVPLREITRWYIERVLAHCQGNLTQAARILEIDRSTLSRQARKLGIAADGDEP